MDCYGYIKESLSDIFVLEVVSNVEVSVLKSNFTKLYIRVLGPCGRDTSIPSRVIKIVSRFKSRHRDVKLSVNTLSRVELSSFGDTSYIYSYLAICTQFIFL